MGNSVISALGPISATVADAGNDNHDSLVPISYATTSFVGATDRDTNRWYVHAPFATSSVQSYIGTSGSANQSQTVNTGSVVTFTANPSDAGATNDGSGVVIESDNPVLVFHRSTSPGDGIGLYPPTMRDLFGFDSNYAYAGALQSGDDIDYYCSSGGSGTESSVNRGEKRVVDGCNAATHMTGDSVRLVAGAVPIAAMQQADSDGREATAFLPQHEFGTRYVMTNDAQYAAIACSPRFGEVEVSILAPGGGSTVTSGVCTPGVATPGALHFGDTSGSSVVYTAGHQIVSTNGVPFYAVYEDNAGDTDEKNILSPVQARKYGAENFSVVYGEQELTIDAEYEQLSYGWYQNIDANTPTSTWTLGSGEYVSEAQAITGAGAVDDGDVLRLRMNMLTSNATGSKDVTAFKLQYASAATDQCNTASVWSDVGELSSTTAVFRRLQQCECR
ncbi:MAG: hypothetical protein R3B69_00330 [Candidatus Paceibacterota bacterium]